MTIIMPEPDWSSAKKKVKRFQILRLYLFAAYMDKVSIKVEMARSSVLLSVRPKSLEGIINRPEAVLKVSPKYCSASGQR